MVCTAVAMAAGAAAAAEKAAWQIDREFKKVERRLFGPDEKIRDGCGGALVAIRDRTPELERSLEIVRSDLRLRGANAAALRGCARTVAASGIVEGWTATHGTGADFVVDVRLLRARRDPHVTGGVKRTKATDKAAAAALADVWEDRNPAFEALYPEVLAPDLVDLHEARWNAGNLAFEGRSPDDRFADGYRRLVTSAVLSTSARIEWSIDAARLPEVPPTMPDEGHLRGTFRDAPPGTMLHLFAELDRRDFVMASARGTHDGTLAGGWPGILRSLAKKLDRDAVRVGQVDVLVPPGTEQPPRLAWSGKRVTLELESVRGRALWTLLSVAGKSSVTGPDLPETDVHVKNVPWDQAVDAIALAHGCTTSAPEKLARVVTCPAALAIPPETGPATASVDERPLLQRQPASALRIVALGMRDGSNAWRSVVRTPSGRHALVRTGSPIGLDGGFAVVDENGVSLVLERLRADGAITRTAIPLSF